MRTMLRSVSLLALASCALAASAQITSVGEFSGALTEGFEGFPNYLTNPDFNLGTSTSIMGGAATLNEPANSAVIYEPGAGVDFGISAGFAQVHGGAKGLGVNGFGAAQTITFGSLVGTFGGYFNYGQGFGPFTFTFFGAGGALLGTSTIATVPNDTALHFVGFASTVGIQSVSITGDYVVADDLQANPFASPAVPGPVAALPFALMALRRRKRA